MIHTDTLDERERIADRLESGLLDQLLNEPCWCGTNDEGACPQCAAAQDVRDLMERAADLLRSPAPSGDAREDENLPPWRCFHCGELFTTEGSARDHFGANIFSEPGCLIDRVLVEEGGKPERGRGLLMALRRVEAERDEWMNRALVAEGQEEVLQEVWSELQRRFGTIAISTIADRLDNERFRADHAMKRLTAAGISFDDETRAALAPDSPIQPEQEVQS